MDGRHWLAPYEGTSFRLKYMHLTQPAMGGRGEIKCRGVDIKSRDYNIVSCIKWNAHCGCLSERYVVQEKHLQLQKFFFSDWEACDSIHYRDQLVSCFKM